MPSFHGGEKKKKSAFSIQARKTVLFTELERQRVIAIGSVATLSQKPPRRALARRHTASRYQGISGFRLSWVPLFP